MSGESAGLIIFGILLSMAIVTILFVLGNRRVLVKVKENSIKSGSFIERAAEERATMNVAVHDIAKSMEGQSTLLKEVSDCMKTVRDNQAACKATLDLMARGSK